MQCCTDDPDVIFSWHGDDGAPLSAYFINMIDVFLTAGHGFDGGAAIHSDHSSPAGFLAELSKQFDNDPTVVIPDDQVYFSDICGNPRQEFAVGVISTFQNNDSLFGFYFIEIRNSAIGFETIISIYRIDRDIVVYAQPHAATELFRLHNAITQGVPTKIEVRGALNTFDNDLNSNEDAWIEFRVNGRDYKNGDDVATKPVDAEPERCPATKPALTFLDFLPTGHTQPSWDRVTFAPMGDLTCLYIKEKAEFCNESTVEEDPTVTPDCMAPGPGGSSFDGTAQGQRTIHPGGFSVSAADYVAPSGGGMSATASDPTDPQSLTGITTPLISFDITLCDATVKRCSQAGPLAQPGRSPATWQINRFGTIEYARSDRFGHIRSQSFDVEIADPDGEVRAELEDQDNRYYRRWAGQLFCEDDSERLDGTARLSLGRWRCVSANTTAPLVVTLTFSDELNYPNSPVSLERRLPIYAIGELFRTGVTATGIIFQGDAPEQVLDRALPFIFGEASDERRLISLDQTTALTIPVGIVPWIHLGPVLLASGSETWEAFAICQYACKAIKSAFGSSLHPDCPASVRLDPDLFSSELLVPDLGNWSSYFSTPYIDVTYNGITVRTTLCFARGPRAKHHIDGVVPFSCNVWGKEDVGDGSGDLITDAAQIVQAMYHWPVLQRARLGNEAMPTFTGGTAKFRTSSAVACDAIHAARLDDGYPGALIVDDFRTAGDWVGATLASYALRQHFNNHGQVVLTTLNEAQSLTGLPLFTDVSHVRGDSFRTTSERAGELENARPYDYGPEPATGRLAGPLATARAETSIDRWDAAGEPYKGDELHLIGVYVQNVARDIVGRALLETQDGITRGEWATDFDAFQVKPGDLFRLTDFRGMGASGWTRRVLQADAIVLNPNVSNPPQEDDLGITVRWQDVHQIVVAPEGQDGGGGTSDGETMSRIGFNPLGSSAGGTGWVLGSSAANTGWGLG